MVLVFSRQVLVVVVGLIFGGHMVSSAAVSKCTTVSSCTTVGTTNTGFVVEERFGNPSAGATYGSGAGCPSTKLDQQQTRPLGQCITTTSRGQHQYDVYSADVTGGKLSNVYKESYMGPGCNSTNPVSAISYTGYSGTFNTTSLNCNLYSKKYGGKSAVYVFIYHNVYLSAKLPSSPVAVNPSYNYEHMTSYSNSNCGGTIYRDDYYYNSNQNCYIDKQCDNEQNGDALSRQGSMGVCPSTYGAGCVSRTSCTTVGTVKTGYYVQYYYDHSTLPFSPTMCSAPFAKAIFLPFGVCFSAGDGSYVFSGNPISNGMQLVQEEYGTSSSCSAASSTRIRQAATGNASVTCYNDGGYSGSCPSGANCVYNTNPLSFVYAPAIVVPSVGGPYQIRCAALLSHRFYSSLGSSSFPTSIFS